MPTGSLRKGKIMKIYKTKNYDAMSRTAANIISAQVIMKPNCVLGLATGSSPIGTYKQLVDWYKKGDINFAQVTTVNLDEYRGLTRDNDQSYYYFMHKNPWSTALAGKRVLVIHPFADTIREQYKKREKLFEDSDILPEFELQTLKAVQTIVGTKDERFETWFEALKWMYDEALKIPFDIAILGCGAYGQPLACMLKRAGKQAIHIGGATQIMFGIRGRRWELNSPFISSLCNENWVRPSAAETPLNKEKNEFGGAYW